MWRRGGGDHLSFDNKNQDEVEDLPKNTQTANDALRALYPLFYKIHTLQTRYRRSDNNNIQQQQQQQHVHVHVHVMLLHTI